MKKNIITTVCVCAVICLLLAAGALSVCMWVAKSPSAIVLFPEKGAQWIRYPETFNLFSQSPQRADIVFRRKFIVTTVPAEAIMVAKGLRELRVELDGKSLPLPIAGPEHWKEPVTVDIAKQLEPGEHILDISVTNLYGRPSLLMFCPSLDIYSDTDWDVSRDNGTQWVKAVLSSKVVPPKITQVLPPVGEMMYGKCLVFVFIFIFVFFCRHVFVAKWELYKHVLTPARLRWLLLAAWTVISINNLLKLPLGIGFDPHLHVQYILYVAKNIRVPLANDGGAQFFQSPLYYMIAALFYRVLDGFVEYGNILRILRIIPLFCGAMQIEIGYRTMRTVFPDRKELQVIGTILCGLVPMNFYISQYFGNEPLSGLFSALTLLLCIKGVARGRQDFSMRDALLLGIFLGLALLSKASAFLLVPIVVFFYLSFFQGMKIRKNPVRLSLVTFVTACLIAGWYYVRNLVLLNRIFVGGWEHATNFIWWQDPSFRTPENFIRFGKALTYPVYSSIYGLWDALYSTFWLDGMLSGLIAFPPWNYDFMLSNAWLALPVTFAILIGIVYVFMYRPPAGILAISTIFIYIAAVGYLYIVVPIYSTAKATYLLGTIPCFGLLATYGFEVLMKNKWIKTFAYSLIICLGLSTYLSFFVL